jgi:hypothetical protein
MSIVAKCVRIMWVALVAVSLAGLTGCYVGRDHDHDHDHDWHGDHDHHDDHDYHGMSQMPADTVATIQQ